MNRRLLLNASNKFLEGYEAGELRSFAGRKEANFLSQSEGNSLKERVQQRVLLDGYKCPQAGSIVASQIPKEDNVIVVDRHLECEKYREF